MAGAGRGWIGRYAEGNLGGMCAVLSGVLLFLGEVARNRKFYCSTVRNGFGDQFLWCEFYGYNKDFCI